MVCLQTLDTGLHALLQLCNLAPAVLCCQSGASSMQVCMQLATVAVPDFTRCLQAV